MQITPPERISTKFTPIISLIKSVNYVTKKSVNYVTKYSVYVTKYNVTYITECNYELSQLRAAPRRAEA